MSRKNGLFGLGGAQNKASGFSPLLCRIAHNSTTPTPRKERKEKGAQGKRSISTETVMAMRVCDKKYRYTAKEIASHFQVGENYTQCIIQYDRRADEIPTEEFIKNFKDPIKENQ